MSNLRRYEIYRGAAIRAFREAAGLISEANIAHLLPVSPESIVEHSLDFDCTLVDAVRFFTNDMEHPLYQAADGIDDVQMVIHIRIQASRWVRQDLLGPVQLIRDDKPTGLGATIMPPVRVMGQYLYLQEIQRYTGSEIVHWLYPEGHFSSVPYYLSYARSH